MPPPSAPSNQLLGVRIGVGSFGTLCRAWNITWPTVEERVIRVLRAHGAHVRLLFFSLEPSDAAVDGCPCRAPPIFNGSGILIEERAQASVDAEIAAKCNVANCSFSLPYYWRWPHSPRVVQNSMRQMYSEARLGAMLRAHASQLDVAVVTGPDFYLNLDVSVRDVLRVARRSPDAQDLVFLSRTQEISGFTNGYYIGSPHSVAKIMDRYSSFPDPNRTALSYENVLQRAFVNHRVRRADTEQVFFKVRNNGKVQWSGGMGSAGGRKGAPELVKSRLRALQLHLQGLAPEGESAECLDGVVASDGARPGVLRARNVSANNLLRGSQNWHGLSGLQPNKNAPASPRNNPVAIVASSCVRPCVERPRRETHRCALTRRVDALTIMKTPSTRSGVARTPAPRRRQVQVHFSRRVSTTQGWFMPLLPYFIL